jgi:hypothetical protein
MLLKIALKSVKWGWLYLAGEMFQSTRARETDFVLEVSVVMQSSKYPEASRKRNTLTTQYMRCHEHLTKISICDKA